MDYTTSVAYNYNETTKQFTKCYPLTHMNAVYTKDDESETLGNKLADIDNAIDDNVNKLGVLTTQLSENTQQIKDISISVNMFGAIGDGLSHLLSSKYTSLLEAQTDYPLATNLNEEINDLAFDKAIKYCIDNKKSLLVPQGSYIKAKNWYIDINYVFPFELYMDGEIIPNNNEITSVVNVRNIDDGKIYIKINGGATFDPDECHGLEIDNLRRCSVGVKGANFSGTLYYANSSYANAGHLYSNSIDYIFADHCGRCMIHGASNGYTDAFGKYSTIYDYQCTKGSVFRNGNDITIEHYENRFLNMTHSDDSLDIVNCQEVKIGKMALGGRAMSLLKVSNSLVNFENLFLLNEDMQTTPVIENNITVGLNIVNSTVSANRVRAIYCINGIKIDSTSKINVDKYITDSNNINFVVNGSTISSANGDNIKTIEYPKVKQIYQKTVGALVDQGISTSPYTYVNNNPYPVQVFQRGGTVSNVRITRGSYNIDLGGENPFNYLLNSDDSLTITFTGIISFTAIPF